MPLFYCPGVEEHQHHLDPEESRHCAKVLRKKPGETIEITDGKGHVYHAVIRDNQPKKCTFDIVRSQSVPLPPYSVQIAISPTKNLERIQWFVEKTVEIGVDRIIFLETSYSERHAVNLARLEKKAVSAMKQSHRAYLPDIAPMVPMREFLESTHVQDGKFVAHIESRQTPHLAELAKPKRHYLVLVGPEGGFSAEELTLLHNEEFIMARIGDYRLRTETAGIVACTILNGINHS